MSNIISEQLSYLAQRQQELAQALNEMAANAAVQVSGAAAGGHDYFLVGLTVFVLACFVGYYVVWRVTPALHSPLMAVTNAVSSVIIVGALIAAGAGQFDASGLFGLFAVLLASINIFGGFIVTQRMLDMFKKKDNKQPPKGAH